VLEDIQKRFEVKIPVLPETIDSSTYINNWKHTLFDKLRCIFPT
jgi:hypothetical protein